MERNYESINFTYSDPANSIFKSSANERARYTVYRCYNKENCDAYKRNKCIMLNGLYGTKCPYGAKSRVEGPTKRAKSYYTFLSGAKTEYADFQYKLKNLSFVCRIGEYVFLNLPHLKNYNNPIDDVDLLGDGDLIHERDFTPDFVVRLLEFRPRALMGGVITSYQTEHIPVFTTQLKRYFPEMFSNVAESHERINELVSAIDYRKKYAFVKTLLPGKVKLNTALLDWDGENLIAKASQISFWGLTDEPVIITPSEDTCVEIYDNNTVTEDTVFRDE